MSLPPGVTLGPGTKVTVTERGYYTKTPAGRQYRACRFAVETQINERMGYHGSLSLSQPVPGEPDNIVHQMQLAGDSTPGNGSTMRQGQKAERILFPDSSMQFGTMSDAEMFAAVQKGATVGFEVDCGKLPRYLKNFVGGGYNGGHYMAIDWTDGIDVDLSDPMYRPAKNAQPRRVPWSDVAPAVGRDKAGDMIVTLGYQDAAWLKAQLADAETALAAAQAAVADLQAKIAALV